MLSEAEEKKKAIASTRKLARIEFDKLMTESKLRYNYQHEIANFRKQIKEI